MKAAFVSVELLFSWRWAS